MVAALVRHIIYIKYNGLINCEVSKARFLKFSLIYDPINGIL